MRVLILPEISQREKGGCERRKPEYRSEDVDLKGLGSRNIKKERRKMRRDKKEKLKIHSIKISR